MRITALGNPSNRNVAVGKDCIFDSREDRALGCDEHGAKGHVAALACGFILTHVAG